MSRINAAQASRGQQMTATNDQCEDFDVTPATPLPDGVVVRWCPVIVTGPGLSRRFDDLVPALAWIRSTEGFGATVARESDGVVVARRYAKKGQRNGKT
jgi:hypothetical protein